MSSIEISVVSPEREEWDQFAVLFSEAEYVVKICEHISAKLNEPAVIALSIAVMSTLLSSSMKCTGMDGIAPEENLLGHVCHRD